MPDYDERRNSSYIKADIEALGQKVDDSKSIEVAKVSNALEALSALYVLEGSIMGGPYIVQMLSKSGIDKGVSFFNGYGENSGVMWGKFVDSLNKYGENPDTHEKAIEIAKETFDLFGNVFSKVTV